jgi:hypothetical protein
MGGAIDREIGKAAFGDVQVVARITSVRAALFMVTARCVMRSAKIVTDFAEVAMVCRVTAREGA